MYGIPQDVKMSVLVGKEVAQLCIGLYQVQVNFDDETSISIEGRFNHLTNVAMEFQSNQLASTAKTMVSLLGTKIVAVEREDADTMLFSFSNGESLRLFDSNQDCESFQITGRDIEIIV
ncbi:MAG: DUF6188 family protein [Phycisphaerae bacterium]|nr:DUF6188 family protein [Phycisphaerae bacterium]